MQNSSRKSGRRFMGTTEVTSKDRERYARARAQGQARGQHSSAVVSARYDETRDRVDLTFGGGGSMAIPRGMIPGLESASQSNLEAVEAPPAGDAVHWPSLDVDVFAPG